MSDEEIKNEFINCIEGTHTLNLAISILEDRERLNKRIEDLNAINEEHRILNGMIRKQLKQKENIIKEAREFVESMEYCGYEDYFYDLKANDRCGNDNTFNDSKYKLLDILDKENK